MVNRNQVEEEIKNIVIRTLDEEEHVSEESIDLIAAIVTTYIYDALELGRKEEPEVEEQEEVEPKLLENCNRCELRASCPRVVPPEGPTTAKIMIVGEGPGDVESETGRPFVGRAGQLLDRILKSVDLKREEVYITNVMKCQLPGNKTPGVREVAACLPWLRAEIEEVNPKIILCLGSVSANALIHPRFKITKERGKWFADDQGRLMVATYHPAYLLRLGDGTLEKKEAKKEVWEDMQELVKRAQEGVTNGTESN